ncbi:DUF4062 domain-containing protein [Dokdonia sp.]|uniref:DUF4062 domain-containing protein n=1 Tax=Dokdonia sp. TaxID=2024995 RepID=UPI00326691FF
MTVPATNSYYGVMISSTFRDLEKHRKVIKDALEKEDLHVVGMESHVARTDDSVYSSSMSMVEKSAAYIGLISHRYGQIIESNTLNPHGYSITRLEYEKAQALGLPTLMFIMHDDHPVKKHDVETDLIKIEKLEDFKKEAKKGRIYIEFEDLTHFAKEAPHVMAQLRREIAEKKAPVITTPDILEKKKETENIINIPPNLYAQPPYIGSHKFVGRRAELEKLNDWAQASDPHPVLLFEAIGGNGKSMLTWEWTNNHASETRTDWAGKFWYSFYERGALMSDFCRHALAYMTQKLLGEFKKKKMPELTELLLAHLRAKPWLFILDGLERVLVAYHRIDAAEILDEEVNDPTDIMSDRNPCAAIRPQDDDLILALASVAPSKILISSRLIPKVLINPSNLPIAGVQRFPLTGLRPKDAEALIKSCGVSGDSKKIQNYLSENCDCHPLVIGVLAGLITDYLPDRDNFDAWVDDPELGGGKLNLGTLDLVQKRNHILKTALESLHPMSKQLLSTLSMLTDVIDYPTLCAFNPHLDIEAENVSQPQAISLLKETVKNLEQRGFVQYDHLSSTYNLHPVVRGVVAGSLQSEKRVAYGQLVVDYFSQKAHKPYEEVETLEDVSNGIHIVRTLLKMGEFQKAYEIYVGELSIAIKFNLEAHNENLMLLRPFFLNSWSEMPEGVSKAASSIILNSAAISIGYSGEIEKALMMFNNILEYELKERMYSHNFLVTLCSMSVFFLRITMPKKSIKYIILAIKGSILVYSQGIEFLGRCNYFYCLIFIGEYKKANEEWKWIEKNINKSWSRSLYRLGTAESVFCNYQYRIRKLKEKDLIHAEQKARKGKNRTVIRRLLLLRGVWNIDKNKLKGAEKNLLEAVMMARKTGKVEPQEETLLALTKLKLGTLQNPKEKALELEKMRNPHHLSLAQLWEAIGDTQKATDHALLAYKKYWGEGEPYVDRFYLERTKKLLLKLGTTPPDLPPYDPTKDAPNPIEAKIVKAIAQLRKEKEEEQELKEEE